MTGERNAYRSRDDDDLKLAMFDDSKRGGARMRSGTSLLCFTDMTSPRGSSHQRLTAPHLDQQPFSAEPHARARCTKHVLARSSE